MLDVAVLISVLFAFVAALNHKADLAAYNMSSAALIKLFHIEYKIDKRKKEEEAKKHYEHNRPVCYRYNAGCSERRL